MVRKNPICRTAVWLIFLLALLTAAPAPAAEKASPEPPKAAAEAPRVVEYAAVPVVKGYPAGENTPMFVLAVLPKDVTLAGKGDGKTPMTLDLAENKGVTLTKAALLPPFEGDVYRDKVLMRLEFKVDPKAGTGDRSMEGKLTLVDKEGKKFVQDVKLPLTVLAAGEKPEVLNEKMLAALNVLAGGEAGGAMQNQPSAPEAVSAAAPGSPTPAADPAEEDPFAGKSLWILLGLVLAAGLGLNLTPCVYPLIPITVGFFAGRSRGSRSQTMVHALLYWAGMVITYTLLGAVISVSGQMLGQALTSPGVTVFIALVILVMASSMFGFWEIRLPASLNRLASQNKGGYFGTLFMGLTVGLLAAPCVGPFVVGLMTHVALKGSLAYGLLVFFTLSFGLGLPQAVVAFFSGSISRLPGAGGWMIWVRRLFGVVLVLMAIYILQPLLSKEAYRYGMAIAALIGGLYLAFLEKSGKSGFKAVKLVLGLCLAVGAGAFFFFTQAPEAGVKHIAWTPYSDKVMEQARQENQPVFVKVAADWCAPCRQMDATTFVNPMVMKLLEKFKTVKVDVTNGAPPYAAGALQHWRVRGVPTMLFFDRKGRWIKDMTIVGYAPADRLSVYLEAVLKNSPKS